MQINTKVKRLHDRCSMEGLRTLLQENAWIEFTADDVENFNNETAAENKKIVRDELAIFGIKQVIKNLLTTNFNRLII